MVVAEARSVQTVLNASHTYFLGWMAVTSLRELIFLVLLYLSVPVRLGLQRLEIAKVAPWVSAVG